jgi:hypothetical protein
MCSLYCCQFLWSVSRLVNSIVFPVQLWVWAEKCAGVVLLWSLVDLFCIHAFIISSIHWCFLCVFCHCTHLLTFSNVKDDGAPAPNPWECYLMSTGVMSTHGWMVNEDDWKWFMNKNYGWKVDEKEISNKSWMVENGKWMKNMDEICVNDGGKLDRWKMMMIKWMKTWTIVGWMKHVDEWKMWTNEMKTIEDIWMKTIGMID